MSMKRISLIFPLMLLLAALALAACSTTEDTTPAPEPAAPAPAPTVDVQAIIQQTLAAQQQPESMSAADVAKAVQDAMAAQPGVTQSDVAQAIADALEARPGVSQTDVADAIASALADQPAQEGVTQAEVAQAIADALAKQTPSLTEAQVAEAIGKAMADQPGVTSEDIAMAVDKAMEAQMEAITAALAPQTQAMQETGLVGKLEGPSVVTDTSMFPMSFGEAPQLAELVAAGKLPPVAERLPVQDDLMVLEPLHGTGEYGGILRRGFTGPADKWNGYRCCTGPDHMLFWDYTGNNPGPNVIKSWEVENEGREFTFKLREGMKWSDGAPFTADDFEFWYEYLYNNEELVPTKSAVFAINGKQGTLKKIDATTIKVTFEDPYYFFLDIMAGSTHMGGHAYQGPALLGMVAPKHYLEQFVPAIAGEDAVNAMVEAEGYDNWVNLIKFKNDWALNPELPAITPWTTVTPINTDTWKLERNPYYWMVDTDGNQLPYIDTVILTLAEDLEVINLRAIAGEYDWQGRHLNMAKVPLYIENQEKGGYKLHFDTQEAGADATLKFNMAYQDDPYLGDLYRNVDFRRALAIGIDREQMNEVFFLGFGVPGSFAPAPTNPFSPGPESEYRGIWATFDPDTANEMLDQIVPDKDGEGFRLRTDNGERLVVEVSARTAQFIEFVGMAEMIAEHWERYLGVKVNVVAQERSLAGVLQASDENQLRVSWGDGSEHLFTFPFHVFPFSTSNEMGSALGQWYQSNGEKGMEPHPELLEVMTLYRKAFGVPEAERIEIGKQIWRIVLDQAWSVGLVGQSPASLGVRVAKVDLGNVPERQFNSPDTKTPGISRLQTLFWKSAENRQRQALSYE